MLEGSPQHGGGLGDSMCFDKSWEDANDLLVIHYLDTNAYIFKYIDI